jgi:hypothetical protein
VCLCMTCSTVWQKTIMHEPQINPDVQNHILGQQIFSLCTILQSMQRIYIILCFFLLYIPWIMVSELITCKGRNLNVRKSQTLWFFFHTHYSFRWYKGNCIQIIRTLTFIMLLFYIPSYFKPLINLYFTLFCTIKSLIEFCCNKSFKTC